MSWRQTETQGRAFAFDDSRGELRGVVSCDKRGRWMAFCSVSGDLLEAEDNFFSSKAEAMDWVERELTTTWPIK